MISTSIKAASSMKEIWMEKGYLESDQQLYIENERLHNVGCIRSVHAHELVSRKYTHFQWG